MPHPKTPHLFSTQNPRLPTVQIIFLTNQNVRKYIFGNFILSPYLLLSGRLGMPIDFGVGNRKQDLNLAGVSSEWFPHMAVSHQKIISQNLKSLPHISPS